MLLTSPTSKLPRDCQYELFFSCHQLFSTKWFHKIGFLYVQNDLNFKDHVFGDACLLDSKQLFPVLLLRKVYYLSFFFFFFFFYFNLYIYPPDSQESDGGAIHRVSNYPDLLPEMPRYCCPLVS